MIGYKLLKIWRPEVFQGAGKKNNYFEGWYYKLIDKNEQNVLAIIPGVSIIKDKDKRHTFIQIINGKTNMSNYFTYGLNSFSYSRNKFEVEIEKNYFSLNKIMLDISSGTEQISGELNFRELVPWPANLLSPGTMGWYSFAPFMQCYHETISFNHKITGSLWIGSERIDFDDGRGYMEKDWGDSFPSSWIWAQSNHFETDDISIMVSIANIPWLNSHFTGFIVGLWKGDKVLRFTTYTGSRLTELMVLKDSVKIKLIDKKYELMIAISKSEGGKLYSPLKGSMIGEIKESISAEIYFELYELIKDSRNLLYTGKGRNAGLEIMGDLNELLKN